MRHSNHLLEPTNTPKHMLRLIGHIRLSLLIKLVSSVKCLPEFLCLLGNLNELFICWRIFKIQFFLEKLSNSLFNSAACRVRLPKDAYLVPIGYLGKSALLLNAIYSVDSTEYDPSDSIQ